MPTSTLTPEQKANEAAAQAARFGTPAPTTKTTGIVTSDDAANRAKTANSTLDSISKKVKSQYTTTDGQRVTLYTDGTKTYSDSKTSGSSSKAEGGTTDTSNPFAALYSQISVLQQNLNKAKEAEEAAKQAKDEQDLQVKLKGMDSASEAAAQGEADLTAAGNAINGTGDTSGIEDPLIKMYTDTFMNKVAIINDQAQTLEQYRSQMNEYTQQDIDSIVRTAARSVKNQEAENERTKRAMEFAGVLGGRAQFSPIIEESIISDVIREGLDEIEVINEKKNTAIREARKAEAEFNIDVFEQQAELAKEYYNEIETTFSAMNARVRQVEQDERDRLTFRQEQEERNAFILAPELMDASQEEIMQAAAANGIDPGMLAREVKAYADEQRITDLDIQGKELGLDLDRERILSEQQSRGIEWKKYTESKTKETEADPLSLDEIKDATVLYGVGEVDRAGNVLSTLIPNHWTNDDLAQFNSVYGEDMRNAETIDEKQEVMRKFNTTINAIGEGAEKGLEGEELNNYVADQIASSRKPISEVKQEATNLVKNEIDSFVRAAREAGNDALGPSKKRDVTAWIMSPSTQSEIEELAKTMSASQILKELKKRYGEEEK